MNIMKILIKYTTIFLAFVLFSFPCAAQELTFQTVSDRMVRAVSIFTKRFQEREFEGLLRPYDLDRLGYVVKKLNESKYTIFSGKVEFSQPFILSLHYDVSAYEEFLKSADILRQYEKRLIPWSTYYGLLNASWNLELKAKVLKKSQKDRVEVKVNTVDDKGSEVNKCIVW